MTHTERPLNILAVHSSGRQADSASRTLTSELVTELGRRYPTRLVERDLSQGIELVDEAWINANFTAADERSDAERDRLAFSDELVTELKAADVLVVGAPMYNFGIPAALKAWVDQVTRARETFHYTSNGPEGLLSGKKAYIVFASGGVPAGSPVDFATPYLQQLLGFIGFNDIEVVAADGLVGDAAGAMDRARATIAELVHTAPAQGAAG